MGWKWTKGISPVQRDEIFFKKKKKRRKPFFGDEKRSVVRIIHSFSEQQKYKQLLGKCVANR